MSNGYTRNMDKRLIRDRLRLAGAICFSWLYVPALLCYRFSKARPVVEADVKQMMSKLPVSYGPGLSLLYLLHNNRYFRTLFYHRLGPVRSLLVSWLRPGDRYLTISATTRIGPGVILAHPYATIINAERIGRNFSFIHLTTIGEAKGLRPVIGDNVTLGANVTIVGGVTIGDDVTVGAGSVVVSDIPSGSVAVGNPARVVGATSSMRRNNTDNQ